MAKVIPILTAQQAEDAWEAMVLSRCSSREYSRRHNAIQVGFQSYLESQYGIHLNDEQKAIAYEFARYTNGDKEEHHYHESEKRYQKFIAAAQQFLSIP